MAPIIVEGLDGFRALEGQNLGKSEWYEFTQERIHRFADVGRDWNYIHVDPPQAARGPFGKTVAHGFHVVSLFVPMMQDVFLYEGIRFALNYGLDRLRFTAPVPVDSSVRLDLTVTEVKDIENGVHVVMDLVTECDAVQDKPVCVAKWLANFYE